ncbi:hypothetical protein [Undibacterium sp.]|uniref:hypothetical protein n=1 Tax=Undibacterium sp. TaxID=1914977 RepID=UPI0025D1F32E|nr:hypothetical protein [Undibacterium sp.]
MSTRTQLISIWLTSFGLAVLICETLFLRTTSDGIPFLLSDDRLIIYKSLAIIYGPNLGAIIAAVYTKPFSGDPDTRLAIVGFRVAVVVTLFYNFLLLYLVSLPHWSQSDSVEVVLERAKTIGVSLAFLVAPINAYFFGVKAKEISPIGSANTR